MTNRFNRLASVAISGVAIALTAAALAPSCARAQSADLVLCDRLAADPSDPDKPADVKGVADIAASDVPTAVKFCKQAAASRRALYELGRRYYRHDEKAAFYSPPCILKYLARGANSCFLVLIKRIWLLRCILGGDG